MKKYIHHIPAKVCLLVAVISIMGTSALAAASAIWPCHTEQDSAFPQEGFLSVKELVHLDRINYAREKGCIDPEQIVDGIGDTPLADLLLSVAIEESRCNKTSVGDAGEQGAWQVLENYWGPVPREDVHGQARQAEKIIVQLLESTRDDHQEAMAQYNGGPTPPDKSYRYAKRVINRQQELALRAKAIKENTKQLAWYKTNTNDLFSEKGF